MANLSSHYVAMYEAELDFFGLDRDKDLELLVVYPKPKHPAPYGDSRADSVRQNSHYPITLLSGRSLE